ncbi:MAG: amidohydrolase family protein [Gemmatimonadetes bacterium]|nr:amidohydrolase family protein [Gemmatimonadota bacterium]
MPRAAPPRRPPLTEIARSLALVLTVFVANSASGQTAAPPVVIKAGRLIDGRGGPPIVNAVIVIEGDKIVRVGPALPIPPGSRVIDLSSSTVLPGLIDLHTHLTTAPGPAAEGSRMSHVDAAILAPLQAQRTLEAGFTTVRDLGAPEFVDVALRNAIDRGTIPGPRIIAATMAISATGGHGDDNGRSPYLRSTEMSGVADGVDEVRRKVRFLVKYGADVIKVMATAGALSEEESVDAALYTQAELDAIVEEARTWGRRVAAHAHGAEGIKRAVRAGVATIDHGTFLDEEGAKLMAARGTILVKDSYEDRWFWERAAGWGYPKLIVDKMGAIVAGHEAAFKLALKHGVRIGFGTDAGVNPHGDNARQFRDFIAWGMSPMAAIVSATSTAAEALGWQGKIGGVAPGYFADLIATAGNPLEDPAELERVTFVMKGGVLVRHGK